MRRLDALWSAVAGPDALALFTPVELEGRELRTVAEFTVRPGDRVPFVLEWHPSHEPGRPRLDASHAIDETVDWWETWARRSSTPVRIRQRRRRPVPGRRT